MGEIEDLLSAVIVALARTWDSKLPGFRAEFQMQIDDLFLQTPLSKIGLRSALEELGRALDDPDNGTRQ